MEVLTKENMLMPNKYGNTTLHYAAMHRNLDQVPVEILTKENMLVPGNNGSTPLHYAAMDGHLDKIPVEILTKENMLVPNKYGVTPLHKAAIDQIPISTLAELKKSGHLAKHVTSFIDKRISDYLTSHEPYDPFDL